MMSDREHPRELRLFISSTFRDLREEREYLVKKVFPEIRSICRTRDVTFTEIDLRWGLTEEEAAHGRIVRTCLEEIDRCRPYFLGIIGDRYGWCPEFHEVVMDPELQTRYAWVEEAVLEGKSILEMEFMHGVLQNDCRSAFFYCRQSDQQECDDPDHLAALISQVRSCGRPFREFTRPEELGELVRNDLLELIQQEWPPLALPSQLELDRQANTSFASSRRRAYIPIPEYMQRCIDWMKSPSPPLVITAESGMGKSALVAWLTSFWRRRDPEAFVIEQYVGIAGTSSDHAGLIRRVIGEIAERYDIEEELPDSLRELEEAFPEWLARVGALPGHEGEKLLLAIDAVEGMRGSSRLLDWLPKTLPESIALVLSTRPGDVCERLRQRGWEELPLRPLQLGEREAIIVRYLGEFHKGLSAGELRRIGDNPKSSSPLFLRSLSEELRLHGLHEELSTLIDHYLQAPDIDRFFQLMVERMESDYGRPLVSSVLSSLAISRSGLTETELLGINQISRADLSTFLHALSFHLLRNEGRLNFFHDYLRRAVESRYLSEPEELRRIGLRVAGWFATAVEERPEGESIDHQTLSELLHALYRAGEKHELRRLLATPSVLLAMYEAEPEGEYDLLHYWSLLADSSELPEIYRDLPVDDRTTDQPTERKIDLLLALVRLFRSVGEWEEAEKRGGESVDLARSIDDRRLLRKGLDSLGEILLLRGSSDRALRVVEESRSLAEAAGETFAVALAEGEIGGIELERGEYARAYPRFVEMYRICRDRKDRSGMARASSMMGQIHLNRQEYDQAVERYGESLYLYELLGDRRNRAFTLGQFGLIAWNRKEYDVAMEYCRREAEIYRGLGDQHGAGMAICKIGLIHLDRNDLDRAEESFRSYLEVTTRIGYARGTGFALGDIGIVLLRRRQFDAALDYFERGLQTHRALGFPFGVALWLKWKGETVVERYEGEESIDWPLLEHARSWLIEAGEVARTISKEDTVEEVRQLLDRLERLRGALPGEERREGE